MPINQVPKKQTSTVRNPDEGSTVNRCLALGRLCRQNQPPRSVAITVESRSGWTPRVDRCTRNMLGFSPVWDHVPRKFLLMSHTGDYKIHDPQSLRRQ